MYSRGNFSSHSKPYGFRSQILGLVGWLLVSFGVAWFGSRFEQGAWYQELNTAPWTPPGWVFGVAWSILYILMAVAAWLIWRRGGLAANSKALGAYGVQMLFNALWSWLFFGLQKPGFALLDLSLLLVALTTTLFLFWRKSLFAGLLLIPYYLWILYALSLNIWIWVYN
ncbi:MAG: TspO/MBR family protein [Opitutales bacterium]